MEGLSIINPFATKAAKMDVFCLMPDGFTYQRKSPVVKLLSEPAQKPGRGMDITTILSPDYSVLMVLKWTRQNPENATAVCLKAFNKDLKAQDIGLSEVGGGGKGQ